MKKLAFVQSQDARHWVGDGFPVRSIFSYHDRSAELSPFLLLDYAGPTTFTPTKKRRGVGDHPHRGFETVTIVYAGEVEHRDSTGSGGIIGPGDVQWMTAAGGIVHQEFHSAEFAKSGGPFEVIQLWVNLPAKDKMIPAGYQPITSKEIPLVELADDTGSIRVIAGDFNGTKGPARTFTPMNVWDVRLKQNAHLEFNVPKGYTTGLFVLHGGIRLGSGETIAEAQLAVLERDDEMIVFDTLEDTTLLLLNGEPLDEPVVGYGPFVMNNQQEIQQAIIDYQSGQMGRITRQA
jgi:redox-sensitive bicupin YhaK (pirin superfamily)